jgi:3-oxoadipate enol-lactonase
MDDLANEVAAFMEAKNITRPFVACGLSMGGYVALALYRDHAPRLAGLILAATKAGADSEEARQNRDKSADLARREGPKAIAAAMLPKMLGPQTYHRQPGLVEKVNGILESASLEGILGALEGMKERPDSTVLLSEIRLPTLILHGADDQLIPVKEAHAMKEAIYEAQLEVLPGAGHLLNLEQPEAFNNAVRRFLDSINRRMEP